MCPPHRIFRHRLRQQTLCIPISVLTAPRKNHKSFECCKQRLHCFEQIFSLFCFHMQGREYMYTPCPKNHLSAPTTKSLPWFCPCLPCKQLHKLRPCRDNNTRPLCLYNYRMLCLRMRTQWNLFLHSRHRQRLLRTRLLLNWRLPFRFFPYIYHGNNLEMFYCHFRHIRSFRRLLSKDKHFRP